MTSTYDCFLYDDPFGALSPNQPAKNVAKGLCFYKISGPFTLCVFRETSIMSHPVQSYYHLRALCVDYDTH